MILERTIQSFLVLSTFHSGFKSSATMDTFMQVLWMDIVIMVGKSFTLAEKRTLSHFIDFDPIFNVLSHYIGFYLSRRNLEVSHLIENRMRRQIQDDVMNCRIVALSARHDYSLLHADMPIADFLSTRLLHILEYPCLAFRDV